MGNCKLCQAPTVLLSVKCGHNYVVTSDSNVVDTDIENFGAFNGDVLQMRVCSNCGLLHGSFPLVKPVEEVEDEPQVEYISEYIKTFDAFVRTGAYQEANSILKKLSIRISPVDYGALAEGYAKYQSIRHTDIEYVEFDELIMWLVQRYHDAVYQPIIR